MALRHPPPENWINYNLANSKMFVNRKSKKILIFLPKCDGLAEGTKGDVQKEKYTCDRIEGLLS